MKEHNHNIMVAHSFFLNNDRKQNEEKIKPYPPLATLYAASVLRANGYSISFFDAQLAPGLMSFFSQFEASRPDILVLYEDDFNFLTKMCLSHVRKAALEMIEFAKHPGLKIIVHSADATDNPHEYLAVGADYVIAGEGEESLLGLVNSLTSSKQTSQQHLKGLIYVEDDEMIRNPAQPTMRDLGHLPQPAWDLVNFKSYQDIWLDKHGYFSINMVTTRGCPYHCNWCSKPIWGQQYVSHSPDYMVKQLEILISHTQLDHIWFADDIFGLKKGWVEEFAKQINFKNIRITYTTQTRADLVTDIFAAALKSSGCKQVWLGVESGSQAVLDSMEKGLNLNQIEEARELLKAQGIQVGFFIQLGYTGEDVEQINETRDMILKLRPEEIGVSVSYPLPGTTFHESVKNDFRSKTNWQESGDLDPTFASTFNADFYQQVRNHLHEELKLVNTNTENIHLPKRWFNLIKNSDQYRNAKSNEN